MKRFTFRTLALALLLAVIAGGYYYFVARERPVPVVIGTVEQGLVESTVTNTRVGEVKACRRAYLSPAVGGQIALLNVKEGDHVQAGEVLLELWNRDLKAQLELVRRECEAAEAKIREACANAERAERDAARISRLREKGLVPESEADKVMAEAVVESARCHAAKASAEACHDKIKTVQAQLEKTILRAPFAGTVAEINGEVGEYTTPSPVGVTTLPAVDLTDTSCLYIKAPIDEVEAPRIRLGMKTRIRIDAFPGKVFSGRVQRIAPYVLALEKQARTVDVEVSFDKDAVGVQLLPGYSADVEIIVASRENTLRIPTEAVIDGNKVLVYDKASGRLKRRDIKTGLSNWRFTEVLQGLRAGELVVVSVDRKGVRPGALAVAENLDETRPD